MTIKTIVLSGEMTYQQVIAAFEIAMGFPCPPEIAARGAQAVKSFANAFGTPVKVTLDDTEV